MTARTRVNLPVLFRVKIGYAAAWGGLHGDRLSFVIDVQNLPTAAGQDDEPLFLELRNKCDVTDVMSPVSHAILFLDDECHVKIVVRDDPLAGIPVMNKPSGVCSIRSALPMERSTWMNVGCSTLENPPRFTRVCWSLSAGASPRSVITLKICWMRVER